jgi:hypothetical protein
MRFALHGLARCIPRRVIEIGKSCKESRKVEAFNFMSSLPFGPPAEATEVSRKIANNGDRRGSRQ